MALYTNWTMSDINAVAGEPVFDLAGSPGTSVQLTANKAGKSNIVVRNKKSENSISINAKCGELYEWTDDYIVYITTDEDVINIVNGQTYTVGCALVNTTATGSYSWKIQSGEDNIEITGLTSGTCNITGICAGQAIIEVSNTLSEVTKEILVNVANSEEELKGLKYLSTDQNVITVSEAGNLSVSVEIKNSDSNILSGYSWRSTNETVATVVGSGSVAVVYGKSIGTAKIIIENNDYCSYPLEIICNVVDPVAASEDPYISCNNIVTCTVGSDSATIVAELVGGSDSDATGFTWSIVDSSVATMYYSNDTAQVKAVAEGVTQIIVSHPKASVPRTILVICEPKVTTNCYISLTESIIKMSPTDDAKTITATLVNGDDDDDYDFKWWADSYDKIDMNYTGASCLIEPLSSGTVNIHVSHPKAANQKDIVLYISNYTDFAFASSSVSVTTGTSTFVNMEVPATGVDCEISYSSSDNSLCTVFGNTSVCTLNPGTVPDGYTSKTCVITAVLMTKGGVKQAEAQLLVSVTKADESKPYIALYPDSLSTIITMNKGEKKNLQAVLYGTGVVDTSYAGLNWSVNTGSGEYVQFVGGKTTGSNVQIEAVASGKTTITVRHSEANNPLTLYIIVAGESEPTVTLNYSDLSIYIGEDTQTITASIQNDAGEEPVWTVVNDVDSSVEQDFFTFTAKGNKASLYANKVGEATVTCSLPSGSTASCKVHILEPEQINFFVYDDEGGYDGYDSSTKAFSNDKREKRYVSSFSLYPGETKPLHWECTPAKDTIKTWYRSDSSYFEIGAGSYAESWTDPVTKKTYYYPDGVGTITVTGKTNEGTAILQVTSDSNMTDSVSVTNSYNYLLTTSKSIISATPLQVHNDKTILYVDYEVRPACSKLYITNATAGEAGTHLSLEGGYASYDSSQRQWVIDTHDSVDSGTGIAKGTIKFTIDGETNSTISLFGRNENLVSSGNGTSESYKDFGQSAVKIQVYYPKHTFKPVITKQVPFANYDAYGNEIISAYSSFDENTNTFFLGDGEWLSGTVSVNSENEPYSNVNISKVEFERNSASQIEDGHGKKQADLVDGTAAQSSNNSHSFNLFHRQDYALVDYKTKSGESKTINLFYKLSVGDLNGLVENYNETVKETSLVGYLTVSYFNYAAGTGNLTYKFPVYVRVRNCPCADHEYYMRRVAY